MYKKIKTIIKSKFKEDSWDYFIVCILSIIYEISGYVIEFMFKV